jgi:hypothetical protein
LSPWWLTSEAVPLSQLHYVQAEQAAQPAVVRQQSLRDLGDRFPANAG